MINKLPNSGCYIYSYLYQRDGHIPSERVEISKDMFMSLKGDMNDNKQFKVVFKSQDGYKTVLYKHDFNYHLFSIPCEYFEH